MEIKRFVHVNVCCRDFEKSLHFYTEVLGATLHQRMDNSGNDVRPAMGVPNEGYAPEYEAALVYWGDARRGPYIDLLEWRYPEGTTERHEPRTPLDAQDLGLVRVALETDDLDGFVEKLQDYGSRVTTPQDLVLGPWRQKIVLFEDPDGTLLELVEFPEGEKRKYPPLGHDATK